MSWPDLGELQDGLAVDHQDLGRGQAAAAAAGGGAASAGAHGQSSESKGER